MIQSNNTGLKRNKLDKFYTNSNSVNICINELIKNLDINKTDLIIEPSAGNGSFINSIKKITNNYKFYDIKPEHNEIIKQDFLEVDLTKIGENIHFLGNPPFGRQSSLAIKFIKKSCMYGKSFSYILPKSFKKESLKKHIPLNFHLIKEIDLPTNSFMINNKIHDVPSIFQIWIKKNSNRQVPKKLKPNNFNFVKKNNNPDISFRRVGVYAGKIDTNCDKSEQSHYFIVFSKRDKINYYINQLKNIKFNHNNTTGPKSISKQELIKEFNKIL